MIIPVYRVITTQYPIVSTTTVEAGMVIVLNSSTGYAELAGADETASIGLAADRNRAATAGEWTNRVSDAGNETAASGKLSIYCGVGGEFYLDVDDSAIQTPAGASITGAIASGATTSVNTVLYPGSSGQLTHTAGSGVAVCIVTEAAVSLDAGIPGEYEPNSVNLVDDSVPRTWVKIKMLI